MSTDATRSGQSEDAVVDALGRILSSSEAARSALASTLREGGTAVDILADVRSLDIGMEGEHPGLAGYDNDGAARVLVQAMCWTDLTPNQPNAYFKQLPLGPARGAAVRRARDAAGKAVAGAVPPRR